jgi:MFS family permease
MKLDEETGNRVRARTRATLALVTTGVLSGYSGVVVGAVLPLIGARFAANAAELGFVLATYLAGLGLFQVPAGFSALLWGTRRTYMAGIAIVGAANVASIFSGNILELSILQFLAGAGTALSAATRYGLISSYYPEGKRGSIVGFLWGSSNGLGGLIGLPIGAALGLTYGWNIAIGAGGISLVIMAILNKVILPTEAAHSGGLTQISAMWSAGRRVLRSRSIWALSLGLMGFSAGAYPPIYYVTQYFHDVHPDWGISTAAQVAAVGLFFTLPGASLGGWIAERGFERRMILLLFGSAFGIGVLMLPFLYVSYLVGLYAFLGLCVGVIYAVMYLIPSYLEESRGESLALGIGTMSTTQLLFTSIFLVMFGAMAISWGYAAAWISTGLLSVVLLPLLLLVTPTRAQRRPRQAKIN